MVRNGPPNHLILGWTDWFTIEYVGAVHADSEAPSRGLMIFSSLQNVATDENGYAVIEMNPPMIQAGPYRNVDNLPPDGAMVNLVNRPIPISQLDAPMREEIERKRANK